MIQEAMSSGNNTLGSIVPRDSELQINVANDLHMTAVQSNTTAQKRCSTDGPVAILWDIENCPVPSDVRPEDVAGNIRMALQLHPVITGAVVIFSAYGDFNAFPRRVREGCQRTGVKLIDVPNGRKDAADKAILVDMFLFALDNPPPSTIILISGDIDFAPALHILGQRGYTVILVIPSGGFVNSALSSAGKFVWDWQSIVHGEGFVPLPKPMPPPPVSQSNITRRLMGCNDNNPDGTREEEMILYRGISQSVYNSRESLMVSQFQNEYSTTMASTSWQSNSSEPSACPPRQLESSTMWVAPGDLKGLKEQLVKLLELSGGCMPLLRVPSEYQKNFSKPLFVADYGALKLVDLFKKMSDVIAVDGKGNKRYVYLRNSKGNFISSPVILLRRDKKGKDTENTDLGAANLSSDDLSDEDRIRRLDTDSVQSKRDLEEFKLELQDILVSYSCRVRIDCFEAVYKQRYKKPLDYKKLGIDELEQLFEKEMVNVYVCFGEWKEEFGWEFKVDCSKGGRMIAVEDVVGVKEFVKMICDEYDLEGKKELVDIAYALPEHVLVKMQKNTPPVFIKKDSQLKIFLNMLKVETLRLCESKSEQVEQSYEKKDDHGEDADIDNDDHRIDDDPIDDDPIDDDPIDDDSIDDDPVDDDNDDDPIVDDSIDDDPVDDDNDDDNSNDDDDDTNLDDS